MTIKTQENILFLVSFKRNNLVVVDNLLSNCVNGSSKTIRTNEINNNA